MAGSYRCGSMLQYCSSSTVCYGIQGKTTSEETLIDTCHEEKARAMRAKAHSAWTTEQWHQVLFSDESKFSLNSDRPALVRRTSGEAMHKDCIFRTVKHGVTVMIWGSKYVPRWPGNSPDANPIENLWRLIKQKVNAAKPTTEQQLKEVIIRTWNHDITPHVIHQLVNSMPRRVQAIIKAKGDTTKY